MTSIESKTDVGRCQAVSVQGQDGRIAGREAHKTQDDRPGAQPPHAAGPRLMCIRVDPWER